MTTAADAFATLAGLVNEDGRSWYEAATELQRTDAEALLVDDGAARHWIGRPRGYSKSQDVAGAMLAALVVGRIPLSWPAYVGAADGGQAGLILDSIRGFVERTGLADVVDVQAARALHKGSGASIEVMPADAAGVYGIRPSWVVADELCQWATTRAAKKFFEGLWTSLPKVPGSTGVVISTAGTPSHFSYGVYKQALAESDLWRVSMHHEPAPWIDPALIEAERRRLTDSAFQRLWRNYWAEADDALVTAVDLEAAALLEGPVDPVPGAQYVTTLDVGLVHDATVVVVAHLEGERIIVDQLLRWTGSRKKPVDLDEVTETIVDLHRRYPGVVRIDPAKAEHILQRIRKLGGVPIEQVNFTTTSVGALAGSLLRALRQRMISLPKTPSLLEELAQVRIVENSAGVPRLDHPSSGHDDQAVALALACYVLTKAPERRGLAYVEMTPEEEAEIRTEAARQAGQIPKAVSLLTDYGVGGTPSLRDSGIPGLQLGDEFFDDDRPNGKTIRSPFAAS